MPKRKHSEILDNDSGDQNKSLSPAFTKQRILCNERIEHGKKLLYRALKLAAGFERQKYSRRRKIATQNNDATTLARLDAEYQVLKNLNIAAVAENHLYKTLLKIKAIATSPSFPPSVAKASKPTTNPTSLNVTARLYKANPVREVLIDAISDIRTILGVANPDSRIAKVKDSDKSGRQELFSKTRNTEQTGTTPQLPVTELPAKYPSVQDAVAGFSENESDDLAEYSARIASSSDSDSEDDSSEVTTAESDSMDAVQQYRNQSNPLKIPSLSPSPATSQTLELPDRNRILERPSSIRSKSTFLPSLTMGGYWSGSESGPEDDVEIAPKKNRRGQRARQQLWEKKYGASAKHLQNHKNNDRNKGWDPKRGAQSEDGRYRKRTFKQGNMPRPQKSQKSVASDANKVEVNPRRSGPRDDMGSLHPSWQAAKLAKEKKQSANFQGKKIVFD